MRAPTDCVNVLYWFSCRLPRLWRSLVAPWEISWWNSTRTLSVGRAASPCERTYCIFFLLLPFLFFFVVGCYILFFSDPYCIQQMKSFAFLPQVFFRDANEMFHCFCFPTRLQKFTQINGGFWFFFLHGHSFHAYTWIYMRKSPLLFRTLNGGGFFFACKDLGRMFDISFPACAFF